MIDSDKSLVTDLLESIEQVSAQNRSWLSACQGICRERLPKVIFEAIPPPIWKFCPWGHRIVVMRTPMVTRMGKIIIPDTAKQENTVGWVLSVGRAISEPDGKLPDVAPLTGVVGWEDKGRPALTEFGVAADNLCLVGEVVIFGSWAGRPLRMSAYDDTIRQLDGKSPFLVLSSGDIWGPYLDLDESEWSPEQPLS